MPHNKSKTSNPSWLDKKHNKAIHTQNQDKTKVLELLKEINAKTDVIDLKLDDVKAEVIKKGALAGAVAGGISGGIVATVIAVLKSKLGL